MTAILCKRRPWVTVLFAIAAFAPLVIIWNTLLDIGDAVPELFHGSVPSENDEADAFIRRAAAVEFPSPIDYTPIREVCTRRPSNFRPGLLFSCEEQHGGIGMLRNQILKCVRYAIHGGGALIIPSMSKRNAKDIADIETGNEQPLEYLLDRKAFVRHLTEACPGMRLYDRAEDFPSYSQRAGEPLEIVGDQFEPDHPPEGLKHPREWRRFFDEWLSKQGVRVRADAPVHVKIGQSYMEYPVRDDGDAFVREFGKILSFRHDMRVLAAKVLYALRRRFNLPIDPRIAISPHAFYGAHLRLEKDAVWAWSPDEWRFSRMEDQFEEQGRYLARTGLGVVYVASGNETVVDLFAEHLGVRRGVVDHAGLASRGRSRSRIRRGSSAVTVVTKNDLLEGDDLALLDSLTFDQLALVDFLVMFKASAFMGVAHSSFSWNVALRRHELSRYTDYANEGSDLLRDEFSIIMGMRADYPQVDPFASAMWP